MRKRKTTEQFVFDAIKVHGDRYDYSKTEYIHSFKKVCITCKKHGDFLQLPSAHLAGEGCKRCSMSSMGNTFLDIPYSSNKTAYDFWRRAIHRCYKPSYKQKHPTYSGCSLCKDWLLFSNFKKWFEDSSNGYLDGYHLDKDILVKGNKVYSPETCCFVPQEINKLLTSRVTCRGNLPIGVVRNYGRGKPYTASMTRNSQHIQLGSYNTPLEAFNAYKTAKENYIKELAEKYFQEGKITEKVYNALMKYEVEITD